MKHPFKSLLCAALAAAAAGALALTAFAAPSVDKDSAVIDTANILSADTETYIENVSIALQDTCGAQIGVYTVDYIGNSTMEGYAYDVYTAWGLGSSDKDNGVLLLMATGEDSYWIMRGTGLESYLTTNELNDIIDDDIEPEWVDGDYDAAAQNAVRSLAEKLCSVYGVSIDVDAVGSGQTAADYDTGSDSGGTDIMAIILFAFALILIIVLISGLMSRPRRRPGFWSGLGLGYGLGGWRRRRRNPPPRGGFDDPGMGGGPRGSRGGGFDRGGPRRSGGGFGGGSRPSGGFGGGSRSSGSSFGGSSHVSSGGGSFHAGGGTTRGGGAGRRGH